MTNLTKREQIAAMVLGHVAASEKSNSIPSDDADISLQYADALLAALGSSGPDLSGTIFEDFKEGMLLEMEREGNVDSSGFPDGVWLTHDGGASVKYVPEWHDLEDRDEPDARDALTDFYITEATGEMPTNSAFPQTIRVAKRGREGFEVFIPYEEKGELYAEMTERDARIAELERERDRYKAALKSIAVLAWPEGQIGEIAAEALKGAE